MPLNYYIDESGNSGDVLNVGDSLDFCGQPVFSLACVGVDDAHQIDSFISHLRKKYRIQGDELKSTKIYKNKPRLIVDLIGYIGQKEIPIFIEVVDKKYFISANIVNCHVMPSYSSPPETKDSLIIRNHCADFIYENAPMSVFMKFIEACQAPSDRQLLESFNEIVLFATNFKPTNDLSMFVLKNIEESISDYEGLKLSEGNMVYRRFIPIPDDSKRGKSIWMLPNLSSFTNIYARINLFLKGKVSNVHIYHDEQAHFDEIILHYKRVLEGLDMEKPMPIINSNYDFSETASMSFAKSHDHGSIQVADILAGTTMRYVQEKISGAKSCSDIIKAYDKMLRISNPHRGVGINLVTTYKKFALLN